MKKARTVKDCCNIVTGKLDSNASVEFGSYPFFTCAPEPLRINTYAFDDDVILVAGNNAAGKFHINRYKGQFNAYQRTYILTKKSDVDLDYIYYALKLNLPKLKEKSQGSQTKFLTKGLLENLGIPAFDSTEETLIGKTLSCIDNKIQNNNKINAELEALAKTIYNYWFVQFDFPDENGKPYKSSGGNMVWNDLLKRDIPEGWEVKRLGAIESKIITGKTPSTAVPDNFNGDIPFICIGDIRGNMHITKTQLTLSKKGADTQKNKYIPEGSICVTCIATPGLVGFATKNSQTNQQINSIVCDKLENRYYLYFYLQNYFKYAKAKTGNTFANMNKEDFSSILTVQPNSSTLLQFSETISPIIEECLVKNEENIHLTELRDWLLPLLMNGQVTIK